MKQYGTKKAISMTDLSVQEINTFPYASFPKRGIRNEVYKHFNVRMSLSSEDGTTPTAVFFPYYSQQGDLCGWKRRDLSIPKMEKGHFKTYGMVSTKCKLFGQQQTQQIDQQKKTIIFAEGEEDVLSAYQALVGSVMGTKFDWMRPFVVGLQCGTPNAVESVMHNVEYVNSFEKIVLGFDNDFRLPHEKENVIKGREATENVAASLMKDNIYIARYSSPYKDPNDYLQDKNSKGLAKLLSFDYTHYSGEKIISARDISVEDLMRKREEGVYIKAFPELMKKIHGFRKKELTVLTSYTGAGKSSVTSEIAYSLAEHGWKIGMIFLEEEEIETMQRMIARLLEIKYNSFKNDPLSCTTEERVIKAKSWCDDKFYLLDHFGSMPIKSLMNKIKTFVHINKVDYVILDHLSMVVSGLDTENERKMLDMVMTELAAFVSSNDVGIIAVSHLNAKGNDQFIPPKNLDGDSWWVDIRKENLRGSASIQQLSWIVLGIDQEMRLDKERGRVRLTVLKNRPWSYLGNCDTVKMNETSGLFEDHSDAGY